MPTIVGRAAPPRVEIGELCGLNFGCYFELYAPITLEPHVAVGHEVMFLTRTHEPSDPERRGRPSGQKPIKIEAAAGSALAAPSYRGDVGAGSVIGASAVVREDVPPNRSSRSSSRVDRQMARIMDKGPIG